MFFRHFHLKAIFDIAWKFIEFCIKNLQTHLECSVTLHLFSRCILSAAFISLVHYSDCIMPIEIFLLKILRNELYLSHYLSKRHSGSICMLILLVFTVAQASRFISFHHNLVLVMFHTGFLMLFLYTFYFKHHGFLKFEYTNLKEAGSMYQYFIKHKLFLKFLNHFFFFQSSLSNLFL